MCRILNRTSLFTFILIIVILNACPEATGHGHAGKEAHRLDQVTVTAGRLETFMQNNPQQVEVMGRDEIESRNFLDSEEALDAVPGVDVTPSGTGLGSRISIRGSGGTGRIMVLINGRPAAGSQYGSTVINDIPISMIERIEVYEPPVPVWLGGGASSGAVNIVLSADVGVAADANVQTRISGGSYGTAQASVSHSSSLGNKRLQLSANAKHTDGRRVNNDRDSANISGQWEMRTESAATYDINGRYYYSDHGSPGRISNPTPDADQTYQKGSADFRARGLFGEAGSYKAKVFADRVQLDDHSQSGLASTLKTFCAGAKGETDWSEDTGLWSFRTGMLVLHEAVDHTLSGDHERRQIGVHSQFDRRFDSISITAGVRGDWTSDFSFAPGANLAVSFQTGSGQTVKAGVGRTVNIPTFGQLYQPSHGSIDIVRGNPKLDEEKVINTGLSFIQKIGDAGKIAVTLFREDVEDLIAYEEGADEIKRPVNVADAFRQGVEIDAEWQVRPRMTMGVNYILQESRNETNDKELTYTPTQKFTTTVKYEMKKTATRFELDAKAVDGQFSDMENTAEKKTAGYLNLDFKVAQPIKWRNHSFEMFVQIYNLLDSEFEVHHGYPDDGLRGYIGMKTEF